MTQHERENWLINIENEADTISSELGPEVVEGVLRGYGVSCAEEADDCDLQDIFSELFAYEADLL